MFPRYGRASQSPISTAANPTKIATSAARSSGPVLSQMLVVQIGQVDLADHWRFRRRIFRMRDHVCHGHGSRLGSANV